MLECPYILHTPYTLKFKPVLHRIHRELSPVRKGELLQQAADVVLDGLGADPEPVRDLFVAEPMRYHRDDRLFPLGDSTASAVGGGPRMRSRLGLRADLGIRAGQRRGKR